MVTPSPSSLTNAEGNRRANEPENEVEDDVVMSPAHLLSYCNSDNEISARVTVKDKQAGKWTREYSVV